MEELEGESQVKTCYFCKGQVELKKIDHIHRWKGQMYLFKNVGAEVCNQCGEVFLLPASLRYMDETVQHPSKAEKEIKIPVFLMPESLSV